MPKFRGIIGFGMPITTDGVSKFSYVEKHYFGDVVKDVRKNQDGEHLNDDFTINNQISIVADAFAYENFYSMKYVEWMGVPWKISSVEVQRPRLILSIGGVYNGERPTP